MTLIKSIPVLILSLILISCVSVGTKVEQEKLTSFKKGETTYSQIISALGKPQQTTKLDDGKKIISYAYSTASPSAASFIPFIGAFVGTTDADNTIVNFTFGTDEKLESYSQSESKASYGITGTEYK